MNRSVVFRLIMRVKPLHTSYPALNCCVTSLKNLSKALAFVLMVNFLSILSTLDVDERDFVSSLLMLVLRDTTSAC